MRITEHRIFTLTPDDVDRIKGMLRAAEAAIMEIIDYRCVRPLDADANFPLEDEVYEQTAQVIADCAPKTDELF